jgi:hypothetical protein
MQNWIKGIMAGLLTAAVIFSSLPVLAAGPCGPHRHRWQLDRQHHFHHRLRTARLTPGQFRHLRHQRRRLRLAEARMWADGRLDRGERARLYRLERQAARSAYRYNHHKWRPDWH